MASETELITAIKAVFASATSERVLIGIGDDAAVVSVPKVRGEGKAVLATDMAVEDVHFNRSWSSLFEIGAKTTAANLADIYAMGGFQNFFSLLQLCQQTFQPRMQQNLPAEL